MTKTKSTKRALLSSALALFLCFAMLIGTTFAWFTDKVESKNNIIKAGNLDIELKYAKIDGDKLTDWDTVGGKDNIFDKNALWEPGRVEVVYLEVSNLGSLALKYQLGVNVVNEITGKNVAGEDFKLSDHLVFKVVKLDAKPATPYTREEAIAAAGTTKGLKDYNGATTPLEVGGTDYVALIVYMPETVGNEANYRGDAVPTIELGINLYATQQAAEQDSFGSDYDEDAWGEGFKVTTAGDLQAAINNGVTNIVLTENITLSESIVIPAPGATTVNVATTAEANTNAVVIDLNGKEITGNVGRDADGNRVHVIVNNGNAVIKNGVITSAGVNGGSAIYNADGATLTVENVTLNGAPQEGSTWPSYTVNNYGTLTVSDSSIYGVQGIIATNNTANTTVNNVIAYRDGWSSGHVFYNSSTAKVTINGGTYTNDGNGVDGTMFNGGETVVNGGTFIVKEGAYFALCSGSKLTVNGGDFSNIKSCLAWGGTMTISGGTFGFNPTTYVADGLKAVLNNGKYVVVADGVDGVVGTPAELEDALTAAGAAGSGDTEIVLNGDIDLTGKTWTPIEVDGYHGAGVVTIDGQGATIYGLTAPLFAGGFAGKSGIVIKNLTIADSNIAGSTQGGGAFIDCADSMHVVTLENCHLVNSTVSGGRVGGLLGWCSGYANENDGPVKAYVTISNCSVVDSTVIGNGSAGGIAGHPGASDYTYTTIENCVVKNVKVISHEPVSSWRTGAIVGTANNGHVVINNVTVENVTLTQDGVTAEKTMLYGRFVPSGTGTLVIDGSAVLANANSTGLQDALASGDADLYLPAGDYKMPSSNTTGKVTITGTKETVLDVTLGAYLDSADGVTIEGVTIKTGTGYANGNGSDYAALYAKDVTYVNCTFVGPMRVGRDGAKFINCTFTELGNDYVWTYGNDVTFEGCTFNTAGKAILIYSDGGNEVSKVTVKNCEFNSTQGAKAGAIANQNCATIEIDNYGNGVELVTEGNTYDSNFSGEWRIKSYDAAKTDVIVNGTEYTTIAIDGKTMTIDANKNVTVQ